MKLLSSIKCCRNRSLSSIVVHVFIVCILMVSLVFTLSAIGVFSHEYIEVKNILKGFQNDYCFVFVEVEYNPDYNITSSGELPDLLDFEKNSFCELIIYSYAVVALTIIVLLILAIVSLCISFKYTIMVLIVVASVTFLFCLTLSISVTYGFAETCSSEDKFVQDSHVPVKFKCSDGLIYDAMLRTTIFSWIVTGLLCLVIIVASIHATLKLVWKKYEGYNLII